MIAFTTPKIAKPTKKYKTAFSTAAIDTSTRFADDPMSIPKNGYDKRRTENKVCILKPATQRWLGVIACHFCGRFNGGKVKEIEFALQQPETEERQLNQKADEGERRGSFIALSVPK